MKRDIATVKDMRGVQASLDRQAAATQKLADEDLIVDGDRRLMLRSPNGTYWAITVTDAGGLATVNMGANPR